MAYMNERHRIEAMIPPYCMLQILMRVGHKTDDDVKQCFQWLSEELALYVDGLTAAERRKIFRRVEEAYRASSSDYIQEGMLATKYALIVFYFISAMAEAGTFLYPEDGPFFKSMKLILPAIEGDASVPKIDASAQKHARRYAAALQGQGYYRDFSFE